MPLNNCEKNLTWDYSENCVKTDETTHNADSNSHHHEIRASAGATFKITDAKLYVLVVTLSAEEDNKLLEQLKTGFKRTI